MKCTAKRSDASKERQGLWLSAEHGSKAHANNGGWVRVRSVATQPRSINVSRQVSSSLLSLSTRFPFGHAVTLITRKRPSSRRSHDSQDLSLAGAVHKSEETVISQTEGLRCFAAWDLAACYSRKEETVCGAGSNCQRNIGGMNFDL